MSHGGEDVTFGEKNYVVYFNPNRSKTIRVPLVKLGLHAVIFRYSEVDEVIAMSQAFRDFQVFVNEKLLYSGRAVVCNLLREGQSQTCEVSLGDAFNPVGYQDGHNGSDLVVNEFSSFVESWEKEYRIIDTCKLTLADIHLFLTSLRMWLDQVETRASSDSQLKLICQQLRVPVLRALTGLFDRFEAVANTIEECLRPLHRSYARQILHQCLLESPFANRTYYKPLGYAGDFEMVNMILRDPFEGTSLYAKLVNCWFLQHPPAEAHRNRIDILYKKLIQESARAVREGRNARIFNIGCGNALEIQRFLQDQEISDRASFQLLDFSEDTINAVQASLEGVGRSRSRGTSFKFIIQSVTELIKKRNSSRSNFNGSEEKFDFVYCAGLFDYLADSLCQRVVEKMYEKLLPGGLLMVTNVDPSNPSRQTMEYFLDWNLIYRDARQMRKLVPASIESEDVSVFSDYSGVNVFLEIRKTLNEA